MDKIKKGRKIITKIFGGNPYEETRQHRYVMWAYDVISDYHRSLIEDLLPEEDKTGYVRVYSNDDLEKADGYIMQARQVHERIKKL